MKFKIKNYFWYINIIKIKYYNNIYAPCSSNRNRKKYMTYIKIEWNKNKKFSNLFYNKIIKHVKTIKRKKKKKTQKSATILKS